MAVLHSFPDVSVEIHVDGNALKEYQDTEEEEPTPTTVTRYIEAKTGAKFEICWRFGSKFKYRSYNIQCEVYLDGHPQYLEGISAGPQHLQQPLGFVTTLPGVRRAKSGEWTLQRFTFSQLDIDDGDVGKMQPQLQHRVGSLGQISVQLHRMKQARTLTNTNNHYCGALDISVIPEKALKGRAVSHCTGLSRSEPIAKLSPVQAEYVDGQDSPFATFTFKYRSLDALKALGIVPRSPISVALEDKPLEDLTHAEMRELLRRQRERDASARALERKTKVKRERDEHDDIDSRDGEVTVVGERSRKTARTSLSTDSGVEIVDLSAGG